MKNTEMKEEIIRLVNLWHKDFQRLLVTDDLISGLLKTIDEQTEKINMPESFDSWEYDRGKDFDKILEREFPNYRFSLEGEEWILIGEV
jgi:hypothetical protein